MTPMNRRFALAGLIALGLSAPALAQDLRPRTSDAAPNQLVTLEGADRAAALAQANRTLNSVARLQGRFAQSSPDGSRATGIEQPLRTIHAGGGNFALAAPTLVQTGYGERPGQSPRRPRAVVSHRSRRWP